MAWSKNIMLLSFVTLFSSPALAGKITTNSAFIHNTPDWLKRNRAEKVIERIQRELEWSTRRINVYFYNTEQDFTQAQSLGPLPRAVSVKSSKAQTVHLSPRVNNGNFDQVFAHELVHIIFYQKYKGAIPQWLEEGFANHLGRAKPVNYKWLAQNPFPNDITSLTHPFKQSKVSIRYHYMASQAVVEMLEKKCDMENLLRLSVGRKMQDYINTYCGIKNVNLAFRDWVNEKGKGPQPIQKKMPLDKKSKPTSQTNPSAEKKKSWWHKYMEKYKN